MYEHDPDDIDVLGLEEFLLRQWESIFLGYRSFAAVRTVGRRWCDLLEAGIGCSQDIADELVRTELVDRADRDLAGAPSASALLAEMTDVLAGLPEALGRLPLVRADRLAEMIEQHARMMSMLTGQSEPEEIQPLDPAQ